MQTLKEEVRQKIINAAKKEFAEKGFAKGSMRNIASIAGIRVGNIYNYFTSKDELFNIILYPVVNSLYNMLNYHHSISHDIKDVIREEYLVTSVQEYYQLLDKNRTLMKILLFKSQGSSLENFKNDFTNRATEQVSSWISRNNKIYNNREVNISDFIIHLHMVYMFTMMEEILKYKIKREDLKQIIHEYIKIEIFGWKHMFQIERENEK